ALITPFTVWVGGLHPKPPTIELVDESPDVFDRPLALIHGTAYVASWPWIRRSISESEINGSIVRHNPPLTESRRELVVVRGDGVMFGPGGDQPLSELGLTIELPEAVRDGKMWRP